MKCETKTRKAALKAERAARRIARKAAREAERAALKARIQELLKAARETTRKAEFAARKARVEKALSSEPSREDPSKGRLDKALEVAAGLGHNEEKDIRDARVSQRTADYESGEEVAAAITEKVDLVELGAELLSGTGDIKNASTRLRMWEAVMERMFGKIAPAAREDEVAPPQVVLEGLPRPERKKIKGERT